MADFCKQCSIETFGRDFGDLKNIGRGKPLSIGCGWNALCEGCGSIVVDDEGTCTASWCEQHGQVKHDQ